jgi:hypothetical protein
MSDYRYDPNNRLNPGSGNGIYYFIGALVLIVGIIGGVAYFGPPPANVANAPTERSRELKPPPAPPPAPSLPAAPNAAPLAPKE